MPVVRANKLWQQPVSPAQNSKPAPAGETMVGVPAAKPEPTIRPRFAAAVNLTVEHIVPPILGLLVFLLIWAQVSAVSGLPGPVKTWASAMLTVFPAFRWRCMRATSCWVRRHAADISTGSRCGRVFW